MSVTVAYAAQATVIETFTDASITGGGNATLTHNVFNSTAALTSITTPPVTQVSARNQVLAAGALTLDLQALVATNGAIVDMTGLKLQVLKMTNKAGNANLMTIEPGAADGYDLFGADFKISLSPGQEVTLYGNDATPDVANADAELDFGGTGEQEFELIMVFG